MGDERPAGDMREGDAPAGAPFPPKSSLGLAWRVYWTLVFGAVPGYLAAFALLRAHRPGDAAVAAAAGSLLGYGAAAFVLSRSFRRAANVELARLFRPLEAADFGVVAATTAVLFAANAGYAWALGIKMHALAPPAALPQAERLLFVGLIAAALVVAGPWVEEILFRGLVFRALQQRMSLSGAMVASALVFALAHGSYAFFPMHFLSGFAFAAAYHRTKNLSVAMLMHVGYNAAALLL